MPKLRISFLPVFVIVLALAVAVAVVARIRQYDHAMRAHASRTSSADGLVRDAQGRVIGRSGDVIPEMAGGGAAEAGGAHAGSPAAQTQTTTRAMTRAERFRELLASPFSSSSSAAARPESVPPVQIAQKPAEQPSIFKKIVNAITGNTPQPARNLPQPQPNSQQPDKTRDPDPRKEDPKDPNSDTRPPQLLGAEFVPPQVQDGGETTIVLLAVDDNSGIRSVSGSVTSPTGKALQGFAAQRDGETNRYVGRIQIPKDAEAGLWHINFLSLSDNASNTVNLTYAGGGLPPNAVLRVLSSSSDSTPPTVKNAWLDKRAITAGDKATLYITAEDDKSGVNLVTGVLLSPNGIARIGFGCHPADGDTWACEIATPPILNCGDWHIEQVQLQDKANNMGPVRDKVVTDVVLNITADQCDANAPEMRSFVLDTPSVSNAEQSIVRVTAVVTDDIAGVASVSGQAAGPTDGANTPRLYFAMRPSGDGQTWVGEITVPKLASKGTWNVIWVQALDKGNNLKAYSHADPVLAHASFSVR